LLIRNIVLLLFFVTTLADPTVFASTLVTLHEFTGASDGEAPFGNFAAGKGSILYGTTDYGGNFDKTHCGTGCGTIFSIDAVTGKFVTIHKFTEAEGIAVNAPLASDDTQTFYGAAGFGGPNNGAGTLFKFDAAKKTVSVLYTMTGSNGGLNAPVTGLVLANGGLYGAAFAGGPGNFGGIYRYDLKAGTLKVVYAYNGSLGCGTCGEYPTTNLVVGKDGMVYGTTFSGGKFDNGALLRINPTTNKAAELHAFSDSDGGTISGPLTVGPDGTLYGTTVGSNTGTAACGGSTCGAVFRFDPVKLRLTVLHRFTGGADGGLPGGETALNATGQFLYGETGYGGAHHRGTLYRINTTSGGTIVIHAFTGGADGAGEQGGKPALKFSGGRLVGSTSGGAHSNVADCGSNGCGTIFRLSP
jgi:uncharacterized repeat protein (TIGR03803 family)